MPRTHSALVAVLAAAALAHADKTATDEALALRSLDTLYPGVRIHHDGPGTTLVYGRPMGAGLTPRDSAAAWLACHGAALGGGASTFREAWSASFRDDQLTVFTMQQYIDGVPVEHGLAKVLVLNGPTNPVVYAAGTLATPPGAGFPRAAIGCDYAAALVAADPANDAMTVWSKPELVIYHGHGDWIAPVRAWKITGESPDPSQQLRKTFFVDAASGATVGVRDEIARDLSGMVRGYGSPGLLPDVSYNPPIAFGMRNIGVVLDSAFFYGARDGSYYISTPLFGAVTLRASVGRPGIGSFGGGRYADVRPLSPQSPASATVLAFAPASGVNLTINAPPYQGASGTAQVNAYLAANVAHDYFRDRSGSWGTAQIDGKLPINTGVAGTCDAFFDGTSLNFMNAGGGCVNSAYSTVVAHEYGHFIVSKLGLAQNAFGEGFGDTLAMMTYDTNVYGQDFFGPGTFRRAPAGAHVQFPCTGDPYFCGQVLSGLWWDIRSNFGAAYGTLTGRDLARQLHVNWSLITLGGPDSTNSAGTATAIEILVADDNDGNVANGTPHSAQICAAAAGHNLGCLGAPANNDCSAAAAISVGVTSFSTVNATTDGPVEGNCAFCCGDNQINRDVWYLYTAPQTGWVTISTCGQTFFDTKIAVYDGAGCPSMPSTAIACNDDFCGLQSQVTFNAVSGRAYKVRVGGYGWASGSGIITIAIRPGNDECSAPFPLPDGLTPFNTMGATTDGPYELYCGLPGARIDNDVWYEYVSESTGTAIIDTCSGATFDSRLAAYFGCPVSSSMAIACNDNTCGQSARLVFAAGAGQAYRIRLGGRNLLGSSPTGTGALRAMTIPGNDRCQDAFFLPAGVYVPFGTRNATPDGPSHENGLGDVSHDGDVWFTHAVLVCPNARMWVYAYMGGLPVWVAVYDSTCPIAPDTAVAVARANQYGVASIAGMPILPGHEYKVRVGGAVGTGQVQVYPEYQWCP